MRGQVHCSSRLDSETAEQENLISVKPTGPWRESKTLQTETPGAYHLQTSIRKATHNITTVRKIIKQGYRLVEKQPLFQL
jgi:hypothetical protein